MSRRNLILCGPPGVGKTTLGRLCAQQLGLSFVDTDEAVQQRTGKTAAQLLLSDGEAALRAAEAALVQELKSTTGTVIATGGGVVISAENRQHLHQLGPCVTLTATAPELLARLGTDAGQTRPLLDGPDPLQRLKQLLQNRSEAYAAQPFQLSTSGRSPAELTQLLSTLWTANHSRI
ncbi:MAG TPA: shikimate kinase, partial [Pseudomonadota bacterium]|nr:shikimate kinase [Pseudomonadota bacterium]